ncbi:YidC/Oxa1 family membrane protein insertase [Flavimobilis soli]|uniref:Membrane protein insertase YidC n=1 Tax=Flavimobilis soli TaxID=442709 RepID=A0A2A9EDB4_9MICO|nr:membrane protein insertase YidC [Flavimobilis soli]PFG36904.1 YidC/Oxa1 family membrane protein insertase [Flavimobilis soli]
MDSLYDLLLPIQWVVAWIMYGCHWLLENLGMSATGGVTWVLSIVGLTLVIRTALIPLFFKQIHASRGMQLLAPDMKKLQDKYANRKDPASREAMAREMQELYKQHKTTPFASCMPILLQTPIFFALFRVLNGLPGIADGTSGGIGPINREVAGQIESSRFFGAPLSETFLNTDVNEVKIVTAILIVIMCVTQFFTQRQLTMKNMPPSALEGPTAAMQKNMMYFLPLIFAISGVNFPIGVLVYWTVSNLWSMGQQFYTIRKMPTPGSEAAKRLEARKKAKGQLPAPDTTTTTTTAVDEKPTTGQRQQPVSKKRKKKK